MRYIIDYIRDLYLKITHAATWEEGCTAFKNFYEDTTVNENGLLPALKECYKITDARIPISFLFPIIKTQEGKLLNDYILAGVVDSGKISFCRQDGEKMVFGSSCREDDEGIVTIVFNTTALKDRETDAIDEGEVNAGNSISYNSPPLSSSSESEPIDHSKLAGEEQPPSVLWLL